MDALAFALVLLLRSLAPTKAPLHSRESRQAALLQEPKLSQKLDARSFPPDKPDPDGPLLLERAGRRWYGDEDDRGQGWSLWSRFQPETTAERDLGTLGGGRRYRPGRQAMHSLAGIFEPFFPSEDVEEDEDEWSEDRTACLFICGREDEED
jgi:hypothetical protein